MTRLSSRSVWYETDEAMVEATLGRACPPGPRPPVLRADAMLSKLPVAESMLLEPFGRILVPPGVVGVELLPAPLDRATSPVTDNRFVGLAGPPLLVVDSLEPGREVPAMPVREAGRGRGWLSDEARVEGFEGEAGRDDARDCARVAGRFGVAEGVEGRAKAMRRREEASRGATRRRTRRVAATSVFVEGFWDLARLVSTLGPLQNSAQPRQNSVARPSTSRSPRGSSGCTLERDELARPRKLGRFAAERVASPSRQRQETLARLQRRENRQQQSFGHRSTRAELAGRAG